MNSQGDVANEVSLLTLTFASGQNVVRCLSSELLKAKGQNRTVFMLVSFFYSGFRLKVVCLDPYIKGIFGFVPSTLKYFSYLFEFMIV